MYIDQRVKKLLIKNKGYGYIATDNIPKNTIIIKDQPAFIIPETQLIFSDMFQLLYQILTSSNKDNIKKFYNLVPSNLDNFIFDKDKIITTLKELHHPKVTTCAGSARTASAVQFGEDDNVGQKIYEYFIQYTNEDILLLCAKYMCNAFDFHKDGPVILFNGTIFNHSCLPNVIFGKENNMMYFMTVRDINKGEELCDNYINILLPKKQRQEHLKNQYGFNCSCQRCLETNKQILKDLDDQAKSIETERLQYFGFSKGIRNKSLEKRR